MKKISFALIIGILLSVLLLAGCSNPDERAILATVRNYVKLMNAEDAAGVYMITHQTVRSIGYKNDLDLQFALYNVKFKLEEVNFDKIENGYAYVPFVSTMIKTDDSDFKDVRLHGTFVLAKESDEWKILGMTYDPENDVEYLNQ